MNSWRIHTLGTSHLPDWTRFARVVQQLIFDAIVAGAASAGSSVARLLARSSWQVARLEQHPRVGMPKHCSGLISPRTLELSGLVGERLTRLIETGGAWLASPKLR